MKPEQETTTKIERPRLMLFLMMLAGLIALVALLYLADKFLQPEPTSIVISAETTYLTSPLTDDGNVDYQTYLNQKMLEGVTLETNAAVEYWKAVGNSTEICDDPSYFERLKKELGSDPFVEQEPYLIDLQRFIEQKQAEGTMNAEERIDQEFEAVMEGPWKGEEYPLMQEWLEQNEQPLTHVVAGTLKPHCYRPLIILDEAENLFFAHYSPDAHLARAMAQLLKLRAFHSLQVGQVESALRDLLALHRLSRHTAKGPTSIEMTVGGAIEVMATHADQLLVNSRLASSQQLRDYAANLAALPPLTNLQEIVNHERMMCLDALQHLPAETEESGFSISELNEALQTANQVYNEIEASLKKNQYGDTQYTFQKNIRLLEERIVDVNFRTDSLRSLMTGHRNESKATAIELIYSFFAGLRSSIERAFWGETSYRLSTIGTAVAAYQQTEETFPENLNALIPDYLSEIPNDPFTGNSFVYRIDDKGALIYSFGSNLKDDGGKTIEEDPDNYDHLFRVIPQ